MECDEFAERKKLTFAQAEGAEPLPEQLALKQVSPRIDYVSHVHLLFDHNYIFRPSTASVLVRIRLKL